MSRLQTFETAARPASEQVASWLHTLAGVCGPLYADPLDAPSLDARMAFGEVGRLRVGHIAASRHRIGLTEALAREAPHAVAKMIVQTVGTSVYEQRGERLALGPGECLVYDVSRPHMITSDAHSEHLVVIIPHALVATRGLRLESLNAQRYSAVSGVGRLCASLVESTLDQLEAIDPACEADLAAAILNLVLSPLAEATEPHSALRQRAQQYIREHARDPELTIDRIAQALRCSKRTLHLAFEGHERSVADDLRITRLEGCKAELERHPERAVAEVAYAWGFASPAHFSRLFHQRFGYAPSAARRGMGAHPRDLRSRTSCTARPGKSVRRSRGIVPP